MKAATGELNLTLITVIAVGLILTLFLTVIWPRIRDDITGGFLETPNPNDHLTLKYYEHLDLDNISLM